jgi:hypothetical protein
MAFYRMQGTVQNPLGEAIAGASVAILTQPANVSSQPGSPLAALYAASASNSASVASASWSGQQISFTLTAPPPADIVPGSFIGVSGASPSGYNSTAEAPWLVVGVDGDNVIVAALTNPGAYSSGGTVATSVLPNPLSTDGNGYWFGYCAPGLYTVQVYGPTITERDYADQQNGTVAGGSVLSVALSLPAQITVTGSPITTSGTLTGVWANENPNYVFAGPASGSSNVPTFRALVLADMPAGVGSVASVGLSLSVPAILTASVTGSPVTSSGTLAATIGLATETANFVLAGPTSGSVAAPTFRALVVADMPVPLLITQTLSTATQPTVRTIDSEVEITSAVTSISGSVVGVRGAVTLDPAGTLGSGSFVYGTQGKLIVEGTLNSGSGFNAGLFAQLDTSNAGFAHISGYLAPIIADCGATSHLTSDPLADIVVLLNTTTSLINSIIKTEAKANYLFDLNDFGEGAYIVPLGVGGTQTACLKIRVNGVDWYIPLNTAHA